MAVKDEHPLIYRRRASEPLVELFNDLLSDVTRTRQTALLIAASVAMLLSLGLATLGDVDAGLVKLDLHAAQYARWIVFWVTMYLFIAYILGVVADLLIARFKGWSAFASIKDVEAAIESDVKQRKEEGKVLLPKWIELQEQHAKVRREWKASVGIHEPTNLWALGEEIDLLQKYGSEKAQPFLDRLLPIRDEMNKLTKHIPADDIPDMWYEQRQLKGNLDLYVRLRLARLAWEVAFPVAYAVFALVWTATHPYVPHHGFDPSSPGWK
jgi:uncharacterized membrane protein SpoIIM required for sporulation